MTTISVDQLDGILDTLKSQRNTAHDLIAELNGQLREARSFIQLKDGAIAQLQAEAKEREKELAAALRKPRTRGKRAS